MITRMEDPEGNLIVSVSQAIQAEDWIHAQKLMETGEVWQGTVIEANRGGLIVPFGNLRGFVPASHVMDLPRGLSEDDRKDYMQSLVDKPVLLKVLEVNRKRRRLVFSQREAMREQRVLLKDKLLAELKEGLVCEGVVSGLRDFGAFVDLGGADGLIHISELAWHRVRHPREVVAVGDKVRVYVLHLDQEGKRIGLSLKRLQPNPWSQVEDMYHIGQLVLGEVSRVAQFGAFIRLEPGIEALLHSSQIDSPPPDDVEQFVSPGQSLLLRIISIEPDRQRLGLSLKEVTEAERLHWAQDHGLDVTSLSIPPVASEMPGDYDEEEALPKENGTGESAPDQVQSLVSEDRNDPVEALTSA
jgi:small subunit ribosomal protein S1